MTTSGAAASTADAGRRLDRGAIFAGWVGLGMALVIAIAFELIIAVQSLVFLIAPLSGMVIGAYANVRSARWRPPGRVLTNAAYAGFVTGLALAIIYAALRLLFVFADSGYRTPDQGGQIACQTGPACTYQRYVGWGRGPELAEAGVVDGASFGSYAIREQLAGGVALVVLTVGGALLAGGVRSVRRPPVSTLPESAIAV